MRCTEKGEEKELVSESFFTDNMILAPSAGNWPLLVTLPVLMHIINCAKYSRDLAVTKTD